MSNREQSPESARDEVSGRARAEPEQARGEERLSEARKVEDIGRLAGGVAHDINNMLSAIIGSAELLELGLEPGDSRREETASILAAAGRAAELTRELMAFSLRLGQPGPQPAPDVEPTLQRGTGSILVVDDEPIVRTVASGLLGQMGHHVILAQDGVEAIEVFERERDRIALVILDMVMPRMDGRATFHELRKRAPQLPILLSSGFVRESMLGDLLEQGAAGLLSKPYRRSELIDVLAQLLPPEG